MKFRWRFPPNKILLPGIVSLALGSLLLGVSDLGTLRVALTLPLLVVSQLVGLMVVYLAAKWVVWIRLLRRAGIDAPWRDAFFAYLGGELTKSLPGGIYFQNYLLTRLAGHRIAVGVATSTVLVALEAAVTMAIVLLLGIQGWPWLRPALIGLSLAWILLLLGLWKSGLVGRLRPWARTSPPLEALLDQVSYFYQGIVSLWDPRLWFEVIALTGVYILASGTQLFLIGRSLGRYALSFGDAQATSAFSMILPLMIPIPIQIGFAELTGTGALVALGMPVRPAIALMISYRLWNNGLVYPLAIPLMGAFRSEWQRVVSPEARPASPHEGP